MVQTAWRRECGARHRPSPETTRVNNQIPRRRPQLRCQGQLAGQVTQAKTGATTLASNASYYPNGALAQFTYGNGIAHTMTQNARQLPSHSVDGSVLDLATVFDANGNVAAITDNTASGRQTRSMSYDALDRLTQTTSPMFGTASYAYDQQDNLTRVQITGGSQPRDHTYCYNAANRLEFVRSGPNCSGNASPAVIALGYDLQGNLSFKNNASYAFDYGNRLRATANQNYRYDAQGRRVRQDVAGSQLQYSQYASDGRLVWQRDETTNQRIANAYLAGSLLAEISRPLTGNTTTIRYLHTDALGSPIAKTSSTGAIIETSEYEPYGRLLNRANDNRSGYTGHVMDAASGLTYMQLGMPAGIRINEREQGHPPISEKKVSGTISQRPQGHQGKDIKGHPQFLRDS